MKKQQSHTVFFHKKGLLTLAIMIFLGENAFGQAIVPNSIAIKSFTYDTISTKLKVRWCLNSVADEKDSVGITYSTIPFSDYISPDQWPNSIKIGVSNVCQDTAINLTDGIQFDSTYYVSLWLKKADGNWINPTDSSKASLKMPHFTREIVSFFKTEKKKDTVWAFNKSVQLWKDSLFVGSNTTDTIVFYNNLSYKGMVPVGTGFVFGKKEELKQTPRFYIGLHYESVPAGISRSKIRMYRDSAGLLLIEPACINDTIHNLVYVKTSNLDLPFMLMIDTIKPSINFVKNTNISAIAFSGQDIQDYVLIQDNIANVKWKFTYGKGDDLYRYADSGSLVTTSDTISLKISSALKVINQDNGLRALLIVSDGPSTDTVNLSRSVYRENSDAFSTIGGSWSPLFVTSKLENSKPDSVIKKISELQVYDKRYIRFFRWDPIPEISTKEDKWIEYGDTTLPINGIFDFVPGRLFWVKTLKSRPVNFGSGVTLSLKDTFTLKLPPRNFTDFALPFRFSIRLKDIFESTNKGNSKKPADSLQIYSFDNSSGVYTTDDLYNPGKGDKMNTNDSLVYGSEKGYTVYNPWNDTVVLKIPPTPIILSPVSLMKSSNKSSWWAVKVNYSDPKGNNLPAVYCSYLPGSSTKYLPTSPSFLQTRVLVYDTLTKHTYNHFVTGNIPGDGFSQEIAFVNKSDESVKMKFSLEKVGQYPEKFSSLLLNLSTNTWEQTGEVTVAPHSTEYRLLVTGTENFHNSIQSKMVSFQYALLPPCPNPFKSSVQIRFSVPYGSNDRVNVSILDIAGKKIWESKVEGHLNAGEHFVVWNGKDLSNNKIGTGIYMARVVILGPKGNVTKQYTAKISLIH